MMDLTVVETGDENIAEQIAVRLGEEKSYGDSLFVRKVGTLADVGRVKPDILVLSPSSSAERTGQTEKTRCGFLLLPGDAGGSGVEADCVVTYGMSPKNTLTLSSIGEEACVLALQRELPTASGGVVERQEIKIRGGLRPDILLAVTGALLILGHYRPEPNG
ncbi:hypothetical protein IZU99_04035 [Oscillospiraceae bacterium CM]|nr:hypothetical protein IZU99_04035 [Oscillospiraceae bacterium CM]